MDIHSWLVQKNQPQQTMYTSSQLLVTKIVSNTIQIFKDSARPITPEHAIIIRPRLCLPQGGCCSPWTATTSWTLIELSQNTEPVCKQKNERKQQNLTCMLLFLMQGVQLSVAGLSNSSSWRVPCGPGCLGIVSAHSQILFDCDLSITKRELGYISVSQRGLSAYVYSSYLISKLEDLMHTLSALIFYHVFRKFNLNNVKKNYICFMIIDFFFLSGKNMLVFNVSHLPR